MAAARRVTSTSVDSLRKRERQVMAAAFDLATKGGAFSISFVAKRTSVKALIYFTAPKGADAHLEAEEQEDVVDEAETEEGGRAMPSGAKEQHRARRDANPAYAQPTAPKRTSGHPNGINVCSARSREVRVQRQPRDVRPRPVWTATHSVRALTALQLASAPSPRPRSRLLLSVHLCVSARRWIRWNRRSRTPRMAILAARASLPRRASQVHVPDTSLRPGHRASGTTPTMADHQLACTQAVTGKGRQATLH